MRIACQTQGPPFSFVDKNGKRAGSSIELCELMAKEMGVKVVFQDYDWDGLIPALLSKKADILAADMTPTLKRAMKIGFSTPFMYTGSVVFTKADGPIKSMEDCKKPGSRLPCSSAQPVKPMRRTLFPTLNSSPTRAADHS